MRILITGGRGQLGRALREALARHQVFALGRAEMDVTDADAVRRAVDELRPGRVVHAAARTGTAGGSRTRSPPPPGRSIWPQGSPPSCGGRPLASTISPTADTAPAWSGSRRYCGFGG